MKLVKFSVFAALAGAISFTSGQLAAPAEAAPTVPIEAWSLRDVVNTVQVSPNGEHLLVLKTESKEGEYLLEIYKTSDLSKPIRRLNADPMEILSARWVSDRFIFGTAWQVVRKSVKRQEEDVRSYKAYAYDLQENKFSEAPGNFNIINNLPNDPNHVLISSGRAVDDGVGVDPFAAFRPSAYYKYNLETGARSLVMKGNEKYPTAVFDSDANPRFTSSVDPDSKELKYYYRAPGEGSWSEFSQSYDLDSHDNLYRVLGGFHGLAGIKAEDPTIGYILDNQGEDKIGLYEFDTKTGQIGTKLYSNPDADVIGIQTHSIPGNNKLVAAIYPGAKYERHWFDEEEKALFEALEAQIPHAHQISISSRSLDGNTMIVSNVGPRDPGSYWLVRNGQMSKLGSRNPLLQPSQLADVEFIRYTARDGRQIPAYVTKPDGEGPFPLIVLPHGGPHINEVVLFDEWSQLLANAGYMVIQPQYRMSTGWGQDHFDSAYGEYGLAMQDDKDDGAMHLVKQGLVDPDRIAMFGWSYGGYAALVATSREPNIYQCAIAGAAVGNPKKVYLQRRNPNGPKALDDWAQRRGGMYGINPLEEVSKANIPLLMVHGDVDSRVLLFNMKDYRKAMEDAGKSAQYLTLKGADHFSRTLMYEHQSTFYTKMLDYLANDCGPGGL